MARTKRNTKRRRSPSVSFEDDDSGDESSATPPPRKKKKPLPPRKPVVSQIPVRSKTEWAQYLEEKIWFQTDSIQACAQVAARLDRARGIPMITSILLAGEAGTGKSITVTRLAEGFGVLNTPAFIKLNGGGYTDLGSVSRFTGAAPGLVGHGEGTVVTKLQTAESYARRRNLPVILFFDELDKATEPSLYDTLMPLLWEGEVCGSGGKDAVKHQRLLVVLAGNFAANSMSAYRNAMMAKGTPRAPTDSEMRFMLTSDMRERGVSPAFLSRIKAFVGYYSFTANEVIAICKKTIKDKLETTVAVRGRHIYAGDIKIDGTFATKFDFTLGVRFIVDLLREAVEELIDGEGMETWVRFRAPMTALQSERLVQIEMTNTHLRACPVNSAYPAVSTEIRIGGLDKEVESFLLQLSTHNPIATWNNDVSKELYSAISADENTMRAFRDKILPTCLYDNKSIEHISQHEYHMHPVVAQDYARATAKAVVAALDARACFHRPYTAANLEVDDDSLVYDGTRVANISTFKMLAYTSTRLQEMDVLTAAMRATRSEIAALRTYTKTIETQLDLQSTQRLGAGS